MDSGDQAYSKGHPYSMSRGNFDVGDLQCREPFGQFKQWLQEAFTLQGIEANCMALATCTRDGIPSVRQMLMKSFSKEGFIFFTNFSSRKALELDDNPQCSMVFYWEHLKKSVRIEGTVERIPDAESEEYFSSRPRPSQIGALVSQQSSVIPSRQFLDSKNEELAAKYSDESVPVPKPDWGGYRVIPTSFEFWYGHRDRMHDRLRFRRPEPGETIDPQVTTEMDDGWLLERLSP